MIPIRTDEEIEILRENNQLVSKTLAEVARHIAPGVSTDFLDKIAETFIRDHGAVPGFLGYNGYPKTLCTSVNEQVVHGIPSGYTLKEGDVVSIDCGTKKNGYFGDTAFTFTVGKVDEEILELLKITRESLVKGVEQAIHGNRVGDISAVIQQHCEVAGYSVVREMVGHGLGKNLHEPPEIPNYGKRGTGAMLKEGMVLCIEPMINLGRKEIRQEKDGWTIRTADRKVSAHYEWAVVVKKNKPDILSTFSYIEEVLNTK